MIKRKTRLEVLYQRMAGDKRILILILLMVALFARVYNLPGRTEFLGDQGSTATILYEAFQNQTLPLVGPAVSTGLRPGPLFYYLVFPTFILFRFNPLGMAVPKVVFGIATVWLLWYLGKRLFGFAIGYSIALLYAASPIIVNQNIGMWNPAPIPFLVGLAALSFYKIYAERNFKYFLLLGLLGGGLVQLHYSNLFTLLLAIVLGTYVLIRDLRSGHVRTILAWQLAGIGSFLFILSPYLVYEIKHEIVDIRNLFLMILLPSSSPTALASDYHVGWNLSVELFRRVIPLTNQTLMQGIQILLLVIPFLAGGFWGRLFAVWFTAGMVPILWYKGPLFEHYVYYLSLLPFFLLGSFLKILGLERSKLVLGLIVGGIIWYQYQDSNKLPQPVYDLDRVSAVTAEMIRQANHQDFSFTLLSTRSASDYHYRYFLLLANIKPRLIYDEDYPVLFLVCDKHECPAKDDIEKLPVVPVLCYEHQCKPSYPDKRLAGLKLDSVSDVAGARLFTFFRE